jgi:serine/threonine protein kinase
MSESQVLLNGVASIETYLIQEGDDKCIKKVLRNGQATADDLKALDTEAQALQRLDNPLIPRLLSYCAGEEISLTREYKPGRSLSEYLRAGMTFPPEKVEEMGRSVLETLSYAHGQEILHRDIKPSNLIYDELKNSVAVVDWGLARLRYLSGSTSSSTGGTFSYIAPEQYFGKAVPASDVFAVCSTMIELLTGRTLDQYMVSENIMDGFDLSSLSVDDYLKDFLIRGVRVNAGERYHSTREALEALVKRNEKPLAAVGRRKVDDSNIDSEKYSEADKLYEVIEDTLKRYNYIDPELFERFAFAHGFYRAAEKVEDTFNKRNWGGDSFQRFTFPLVFYHAAEKFFVCEEGERLHVLIQGLNVKGMKSAWYLTLKRKQDFKKLISPPEYSPSGFKNFDAYTGANDLGSIFKEYWEQQRGNFSPELLEIIRKAELKYDNEVTTSWAIAFAYGVLGCLSLLPFLGGNYSLLQLEEAVQLLPVVGGALSLPLIKKIKFERKKSKGTFFPRLTDEEKEQYKIYDGEIVYGLEAIRQVRLTHQRLDGLCSESEIK